MTQHSRRALLRAALTVGGLSAVGLTGYELAADDGSQPRGADAPSGHRWKPYLADGFTSLNHNRWFRYDNDYGTGMHAENWNSPSDVRISGGNLQIVSRRQRYRGHEFTSGFIATSSRGAVGSPHPAQDTFYPKAGFYEMRGRIPHGQGLLAAWWLRHRDGAGTAEVDIMESFHSQHPGRTTQTLHLDGKSNVYKVSTYIEKPSLRPGMHTWGVGIYPVGLFDVQFDFYTDGKRSGGYRAKRPKFWHASSSANVWDMALNTHVGGVWAGHPDDAPGYSRYNGGFCLSGSHGSTCSAPGVRRPHFPAVFEVDYVKVWELRPRGLLGL